MNILITGIAGFIGSHLAKSLMKDENNRIIGIDDFNNILYDSSIKYDRLKYLLNFSELHVNENIFANNNVTIYKSSIADKDSLSSIFHKYKFDIAINLAAYANPILSLDYTSHYFNTNVVGFFNILECIKEYSPNTLLIYASTSSVYGDRDNYNTSSNINDNTDHSISLYAASKKCDEILAYSYYKSFNVKSVGLRLFTVYGPFGRPDMALYKFTKNIIDEIPIDVYNYGNNYRDFTYIDDLIKSINLIINHKSSLKSDYLLYNIGSQNPVKLSAFIEIIENTLNKKSIKNYLPPQKCDTYHTCANMNDFYNDFHYIPDTDINKGIKSFIEWYVQYHHILF